MLLLHLSDLHFRHGEAGTAMDPYRHVRNEILRDVETMTKCDQLGSVDAVLISGDIAFGGDPEEYDFALTWIEQLCLCCRAPLTGVFVCPGNHDVARGTTARHIVQSLHRDIKTTPDLVLDGALRGLLADPETARILYESTNAYNLFAGQFFCDLYPPDRTIARRDLVLNDRSILRLSAFNSTFVSSATDKASDLFVDPACFQLTRERGVEHLTICHHPFKWLRQGDSLRDYLNDVARIQLFGHEHTSRIELARDWVRIAASAAHPERTETGWEPGYNFLKLQVVGPETNRRLEVRVHVRVWQSAPGQFHPKLDRDGEPVFLQTIRLDSWTRPPAPVGLTTGTSVQPEAPDGQTPPAARPAGSDVMDTLREISLRFFKLTLSQKVAIAGKLRLLENEDVNTPDFERFRRVFLRARERGLVDELDREVRATVGGR